MKVRSKQVLVSFQILGGAIIVDFTRCFFCYALGHTIATYVKLTEADQGKIKAGAGQFPDTRWCYHCGLTGILFVNVSGCERKRKVTEQVLEVARCQVMQINYKRLNQEEHVWK